MAVFFSEDESSSNADDAEEEEEESENEIEDEDDSETPAFVGNVLERPGTSRGQGGTRGSNNNNQPITHPMHWAFRNQQPAPQARNAESSATIAASASTGGNVVTK